MAFSDRGEQRTDRPLRVCADRGPRSEHAAYSQVATLSVSRLHAGRFDCGTSTAQRRRKHLAMLYLVW